ncbi:hypothetical protein BT96DRAFT_410183 [Gymnopus androsaceus JB14]|uniref:N-acetyltransferase domain-containing protein n=1 Tax=Gymnopus androsaceus JB14 TaxID=1447944 RepID=A0A6A4I3S6_9AGAR|nr:hypothetical protein BT96DRAFT_410183 [Gymnopus androsaceus JB14]
MHTINIHVIPPHSTQHHAEGSPMRASLAHTVNSPRFYIALAFLVAVLAVTVAEFSLGIVVTAGGNSDSNSKGQLSTMASFSVVSVLLSAYLCLLVYNSIALYYFTFWLSSLKEDLGDVAAWYEMCPVHPEAQEGNSNEEELEPTGPKAFWVAEVVSPSTAQPEIVGCISLDSSPPSLTHVSQYELRRMIVSASHRRLGIAASLIKVCEAHAVANGLTRVMLRTTQFQPGARKLYKEKNGYKEVGEQVYHAGIGLGSGWKWGRAKGISVFTYVKEFGTQCK